MELLQSENKKLGIVITDGVGFRNFVLSDFIYEAQKQFSEVIIYSCIPKDCFAEFNFSCKIVELPEFSEKFPTWFFRKTKEVAHLRKFAKNNFGINDNLKANINNVKNIRGLATRLIFKLTKYFHSENNILFYNKLQQYTYSNFSVTKVFNDIFKRDSVDILFFTHQRPPFIAPLIYQAEKLGIKTAAFIFSWDNLASKGRMSGNFDYYFVWSNLMKQELLHFYESVKECNIQIVGTPQFEPYILERYKTTKDVFYSKFNLNPNLKTICFSCGDISTSKNDELYIETIASFILKNQLTEKVNLIVRTSPAENGEIRFKNLIEKFNFIFWNFPKWKLARNEHQELWTQRIPLVEDVIDLRALLEYSNIFVNMLSTMSLDAMNFEKPVINPAFGNGMNNLYDDQRFLLYKHIQHIVESKATVIVKNELELLNAINASLENLSIRKEQQRNLIHLEIGKSLKGTSNRIVEMLLRWS
jgi:hypothetical protein